VILPVQELLPELPPGYIVEHVKYSDDVHKPAWESWLKWKGLVVHCVFGGSREENYHRLFHWLQAQLN